MRLRDLALLTLMMIGMIAFLPVLVPTALVCTSVRGRRMRRAAETFGCVVCGMVLTAEAVRWADREDEKQMAELQREHAGDLFRMIRTCHAICGTRYEYLERERSFVLEDPRSDGLPSAQGG